MSHKWQKDLECSWEITACEYMIVFLPVGISTENEFKDTHCQCWEVFKYLNTI